MTEGEGAAPEKVVSITQIFSVSIPSATQFSLLFTPQDSRNITVDADELIITVY